jgi:hypothetical protein
MKDVVECCISVSGWCPWCEQPCVDGRYPGEMTVVSQTIVDYPCNKEGFLRTERSCKGKGKVHPRTGHEGPKGGRGMALLFL